MRAQRRLRRAAAALAVSAATIAPLDAHACVNASILSGVGGAACQISVTIQTTTPIQLTPGTSPTAGTGYQIVGSTGTCTGTGGGQAFAMSGSGTTELTASCEDFVLVGNGATVTVGAQQFAASIYLVGPTAASQWVIELTPIYLGSGGAGAGALSLAPASAQACLQPGGTTSLTFSGSVVFGY